ncbi:MAG: squalene/phytoene synthase family protein [Alphaproteobacteria bacterium]|nr:squalene/phytoene synthase family protein [Alphaproteobacteria bacterium]
MTTEFQPNYCADSVRANDPDRYILAMLAPAAVRDALFSLYAFNIEIARTRELVSEPPLGEIRLQWWRDGIDAIYAGKGLRHGVGNALTQTIATHELSRLHFERLIDARSADLDDNPPESIDDLLSYAEGTTAPLLSLALEIVGESSVEATEAARDAGIAWSLIGLTRALPFHLRARRHYLPLELTQRFDVSGRDLLEIKPHENLNRAIEHLSGAIDRHIRNAHSRRAAIGRSAVPVLLHARFAEIHLRRLSSVGFDPFDARLAETPPMTVWRLTLQKMCGRY